MSQYEINGHCEDRFAEVREAFVRNFDNGDELGAAFALTIDGKPVVDLWGGYASADQSKAWDRDAIVPVSSSSKIPIAICGLMLIDRGLIDPDKPVADYWPGFEQNGKAGVLVRHIFSHSSGLSGIDGLQPAEVLSNREEACRRLTEQAPWWTPGERSGYHALTFGMLIGELVRLTTGRSMQDFLREEITAPFEIDFRFGIDASSRPRMVEVLQVENDEAPPDVPKESVFYRTMGYMREQMSDIDVWDVDLPAANGVTNARALSQIGSIVASMGAYRGQQILQPATVERAWQEEIYVNDYIFGAPVRYGLGFGLASNELPLPWAHSMHWGGTGGSSVFMAPEVGASFAYTPNRFIPGRSVMDHRGEALRDAVINCLG